MKFFSLAALFATVVSTANALVVNTPTNAVQCQPLLITWDPQGSAGPFFLSVHPGDTPSAPALFSWDNLTGTSFTWVVTVAAGQNLGLLLRDNTGATSQSAPFPVQVGTTDCSASSSVVSTSSGSGSSLSTVPGSGTSSHTLPTTTTPTVIPTTTTSATRPLSSTPSSVRPSSTSSPSPTSTGGSGGGALSNAVNLGSAGFLAALVGAVLA